MSKEMQYKLLLGLISTVGISYFHLMGRTSKVALPGTERDKELRKQYPQCIYVGWHEQIMLGAWTFRGRNIAMLVSASRDGDYLSRLCALLGFVSVRGSSSRGGMRALLQLMQAIKDGHDVIMVPDGPRGPARECKPGVIMLAKHSGMPIIPTTVMTNRVIRLKSWDRTIVPSPFSKILMLHDEPIFIPEDADKDDIPKYQEQLTHILNRLTETAIQQCRE